MFKTPSTLIILASLLIAGFIPQTTRAQVSNPVYADDVIPVIRITIDPDSLAEILDPANAESDHEFPARFIFDNGAILDTLENVGFRLRGNTSRYSRKKSFKVSFNTFERGRKYYGFEKLNINGEHNDPSIIRSKLCWDMFNELGLVSSRANHVRLYVNEVYYGLYINVEHIDENFLRDRYGNNNGNLYKCLWPADLEYLGGNPDLYKFMSGNRRTYELKTNTDRDDYTDLAFLIANLRFIPDSLMTEFEKIFNVDDFLRVLAVDVAIGNWDNYWFNKNNFYLYNNPESGVFDYLPYDLDNTFGIDWVGPDWGNRDIYAWGHDSEARRLVSKILAVQEYRDRYSYYLNKLVNSLFLPAVMFPGIDAIHTMITPAAAEDTVRTLDYGYTLDDFNNSYDLPLGGHVEYGLKPYIITRRNAILAQLQLNDIPPIVKNVRFAPENARTNQPISVRVFVEDEDPNPAVEVQYEINGLPQTPVLLFDDGLHQDGQAGDLVYGGRIPAVSDTGTVRFFISASDGGGRQSTLPRKAPGEQFAVRIGLDVPGLYINEFMASNDTTIADEFGDFDDWIEIYNGDSAAVWLGDLFLTDNLSNPDKWALPDTTLAPGGYLLIWADDEAGQGPTHTTYKLSADGEEIGIFKAEGSDFVVIDSLTFGAQQTDISYGRTADGGPDWQFFSAPTPGRNNGGVNGVENDYPVYPRSFTLEQNYPNPFNPATTIRFSIARSSWVKIRLYDVLGREIRVLLDKNLTPGSYSVRLGSEGLASGVYLYTLQAEGFFGAKKLLLLK